MASKETENIPTASASITSSPKSPKRIKKANEAGSSRTSNEGVIKKIIPKKVMPNISNLKRKNRDHLKQKELCEDSEDPLPKKCPSDETKDVVKQKQSSIDSNNSNFNLHLKDGFYFKYYAMFENNSNICWLNASISLLAFSETLSYSLKPKSKTFIVEAISLYRSAMSYLNNASATDVNERYMKVQKDLIILQNKCLCYLEPLMKCRNGEPDSSFCALYNLIAKDERAKTLFTTEFMHCMKCKNCGKSHSRSIKKPMITLTKVDEFQADVPISICQCSSCKAPNQKLFVYYKSLPPCLLFHFENGAGSGKLEVTDFTLHSRRYHLTGVITLDKGNYINHFVAWARNPKTSHWLELNDLSSGVLTFTNAVPDIDLENIYILSYDSLDQMGVITNFSGWPSPSRNHNIPLIDLSDESNVDSPCWNSSNNSSRFLHENSPSDFPQPSQQNESENENNKSTTNEENSMKIIKSSRKQSSPRKSNLDYCTKAKDQFNNISPENYRKFSSPKKTAKRNVLTSENEFNTVGTGKTLNQSSPDMKTKVQADNVNHIAQLPVTSMKNKTEEVLKNCKKNLEACFNKRKRQSLDFDSQNQDNASEDQVGPSDRKKTFSESLCSFNAEKKINFAPKLQSKSPNSFVNKKMQGILEKSPKAKVEKQESIESKHMQSSKPSSSQELSRIRKNPQSLSEYEEFHIDNVVKCLTLEKVFSFFGINDS